MEQRSAVALIMYLQRAHSIIPTTGAEWMALSEAMGVVEQVANGRITLEAKPASPPKVVDGAA
jgi:hypothetical protein